MTINSLFSCKIYTYTRSYFQLALILPFLFYCNAYLFAQQNHQYQALNIEDGLSNSIVISIIQDQQGFMWFGTQDGLNRYDGYEFKVYKPDTHNDAYSPSFGEVVTLLEDSKNQLWLSCGNKGAFIFDPSSQSFENFPYVAPEKKTNHDAKIITSIIESKDQVLWLGYFDTKITHKLPSGQLINYTPLKDDQNYFEAWALRSILLAQDSSLWLGTGTGGLLKYERSMSTLIISG